MGKTFFKKVAKCKKCGGILVSDESIRRGYGPSCYKTRDDPKERKESMDNTLKGDVGEQVTIFDILED